MKFFRCASALALAGVIGSGAATPTFAISLAQAAQPREVPPAGYTGDTYVDSRGCAYARVTVGNQVNWAPRLSSDRKNVVCGLTPTFAPGNAVALGTAPPPPPAPPPPSAMATAAPAAESTTAAAKPAPATAAMAPATTATTPAPARTTGLFGNLPTPSPAPEPTLMPSPASATESASATAAAPASEPTRTLSVTCPPVGESARVRIGSSTVRVSCPVGMVQPASVLVRHSNGKETRLVVNPAPATMAAATGAPAPTPVASPATGSGRVNYGGVAPGGESNDFGSTYGVLQGGAAAPPMDSQAAAPVTTAPASSVPGQVTTDGRVNYGGVPPGGASNGFGSDYGVLQDGSASAGAAVAAPAPPVHVPEGYRSAWNDDRLNPNRGPRTAAGDQQMAALYDTSSVPMRERNPAPAQGLIAQPKTGLAGLFSTKSPTTTAAAAAPAPAATGYRYVQVGAYREASNAQSAAQHLQRLGLPGRIAHSSSGLTLVLAGPYTDAGSLRNALAAARRGGFSDAFLRG